LPISPTVAPACAASMPSSSDCSVTLTNFFNFSFDENLANRFPLHIFVSSDDFDDIQTSFSLIKSKLAKAIYHEFTDKEHFCFTEFPELLELL
jgi:hypothetical protein